MITSYKSLLGRVGSCGKRTLAVAAAEDREVLEAVLQAREKAGIEPVLFGNAAKIRELLQECGGADCEVIDAQDDRGAALLAVEHVRSGASQVLMKGMINTSDFMRAVLDKEVGLRTGRILSHLAAFEVEELGRLIYITDGGVNIAPSLEEKKGILTNALLALKEMGYERPKVAVLTANEKVSEKAPATVDAEAIVQTWQRGEFPTDCIVEGPIALDVALSPEAAHHKGINSQISGKTDLFLTSNIEVGNVMGKSLTHLAHAGMSGEVLGASAPIVLTSRAETVTSKLNSILLACACSPAD